MIQLTSHQSHLNMISYPQTLHIKPTITVCPTQGCTNAGTADRNFKFDLQSAIHCLPQKETMQGWQKQGQIVLESPNIHPSLCDTCAPQAYFDTEGNLPISGRPERVRHKLALKLILCSQQHCMKCVSLYILPNMLKLRVTVGHSCRCLHLAVSFALEVRPRLIAAGPLYLVL